MKLMASGVIFSAAMAKSPSFSRSSSSTRTIIRPCRISSTASSTLAKSALISLILSNIPLVCVRRNESAPVRMHHQDWHVPGTEDQVGAHFGESFGHLAAEYDGASCDDGVHPLSSNRWRLAGATVVNAGLLAISGIRFIVRGLR